MTKKAILILLIVLAVVLAVIIGAGAVLIGYISNPGNVFAEPEVPVVTERPTPTPEPTAVPSEEAESESPTATPVPTATPEPTMAKPDYEFDKNRINVLVLGADSSVERIDAGMNFRTDMMMLVTIDLEDKTVDLISIPRDSYVRIYEPDETAEPRFGKINSAFTFGGGAKKKGYEYAMNTVRDLMGVRIDYYVGFGMNVVKEVVDAMGGVDYDVDIEFTMNGRETKKGLQHMDGQKVLDYCRFRKGGRGDVDRVDRQQRILFAMFEQMLSADQIKNVPQIYTAVKENIDTNLDLIQIASLAYFAKDLSMERIDRHTVPGNGQYVGDRSYYIIDQDGKNEMMAQIFGIDPIYDEAITVEAIEMRIAQESGILPEDVAQESALPESVDELTALAQEMLVYMLDVADMENDQVQAAYENLQNAIWSGEAQRMTEAIRSVQKLLPGA